MQYKLNLLGLAVIAALSTSVNAAEGVDSPLLSNNGQAITFQGHGPAMLHGVNRSNAPAGYYVVVSPVADGGWVLKSFDAGYQIKSYDPRNVVLLISLDGTLVSQVDLIGTMKKATAYGVLSSGDLKRIYVENNLAAKLPAAGVPIPEHEPISSWTMFNQLMVAREAEVLPVKFGGPKFSLIRDCMLATSLTTPYGGKFAHASPNELSVFHRGIRSLGPVFGRVVPLTASCMVSYGEIYKYAMAKLDPDWATSAYASAESALSAAIGDSLHQAELTDLGAALEARQTDYVGNFDELNISTYKSIQGWTIQWEAGETSYHAVTGTLYGTLNSIDQYKPKARLGGKLGGKAAVVQSGDGVLWSYGTYQETGKTVSRIKRTAESAVSVTQTNSKPVTYFVGLVWTGGAK